MSPAPSLSGSGTGGATVGTPPTTSARRLAAGAAALGLVVHLWGLYRDHGPPQLSWFPHADKVEHLVGFGLPCFLVLLALHLHAAAVGRLLRGRTVALVVGLFVLHAGVSEVVQGELYTTRSGDPFDALADVVGTTLGLLAYLAFRRRAATAATPQTATAGGARGRA